MRVWISFDNDLVDTGILVTNIPAWTEWAGLISGLADFVAGNLSEEEAEQFREELRELM